MEDHLAKLTKEDLIKVIAFIHDFTPNWSEYPISKDEEDCLSKIGSACYEACCKQNDFKLPNV